MKHIFSLLTIVCFLGLMYSCESDFLEKVNPNELSTSVFWEDLDQSTSSLIACYSPLIEQSMHGRFIPFYDDGRSDELITHLISGYRFDYCYFNYSEYKSSSETANVIAGSWDDCYAGIFRCNLLLENIHKTKLKPGEDPNAINYIKGEAHFLRAYYYYWLITHFREVPLITTTPKSNDDFYPAKAPRGDVYTQLFSDYDSAVALLDWKPNGGKYPDKSIGRATKGSALAHLGRALMFHYGYETKSTNLDELTRAKSLFEEIYNSGNYSLMDNYEDNFRIGTEWNKESIFEINSAEFFQRNGYGLDQTGNGGMRMDNIRCTEYLPSFIGGGWGGGSPSPSAFDEFYDTTSVAWRSSKPEYAKYGNRDPRKDITFCFLHPEYVDTIYGVSMDAAVPQLEALGLPPIIWKKNMAYNEGRSQVRIDNTFPGINIREFRFSEVILYLAECEAILGNYGASAAYMNEVRNRAGLPDLQTQGWDLTSIMDQIEHERRTELCGEQKRFFDLLRWGKMDRIVNLKNSSYEILKLKGENYNSVADFFPIPNNEILINPNLLQDPLYNF